MRSDSPQVPRAWLPAEDPTDGTTGSVIDGMESPAGQGEVTTPATVADWTDVWQSAPGALLSQAPGWLSAVCEVTGWQDVSRLYRTEDGRRLVLPLVRRRLLGGTVAVDEALPIGWGPGGLLGEHGLVRPDDVRMVMTDLAGRVRGAGLRSGRAVRVQVRPDPTTASTWQAGMPPGVRALPRMAQSLFLAEGFDALWRTTFRSDTRNRVRRAERAGVVIERDDTGRLVPVVQELYAKSVDRWARRDGVPLATARRRAALKEPPRKLATVAARLGPACRVYAALVDGRPAAAIVVLRGATTSAYWRGAMDEELAGRTYANYLLHRTAIEDAVDAGHGVYHLGDSTPGSSLALFKSRFGATEQHYAAYQLDSAALTAVRRGRRGVRRVLAHVPGR